MTGVKIVLDAEGKCPEYLDEVQRGEVVEARVETISVLTHGTVGGQPTVGLYSRDASGRLIFTETTAKLFVTAAKMMEARYPELMV